MANRRLWELSAGELCQKTDRGNGVGSGCFGSESEYQLEYQSDDARSGGEISNLSCANFACRRPSPVINLRGGDMFSFEPPNVVA